MRMWVCLSSSDGKVEEKEWSLEDAIVSWTLKKKIFEVF